MIARCWLKWQTLRMYKVRESDIRVDTDVDDVTTATDLTKLSRSWCEHDTLALESVYYTIIFRAFPVVVLELCDRYFGLAQRVFTLSLRTTHHAALAHLAATAPSKPWTREKDIGNGGVCCLRTSN